MHSRILLIGFMGSGKTTLGSRLARSLNYEFVDMDQLIEETAGLSIPGIFKEHGEGMFRKWEQKILDELSKREGLVISTGGGAPCLGNMMDQMKQCGTTIYIYLSPETLHSRLLKSRTERPLLKDKSESELMVYIKKLLEEREPYYKQASLIVDGEKLTVDTLTKVLRSS